MAVARETLRRDPAAATEPETLGIGDYEAIEDGTFKNAIETAQSADIGIITGATVTSRAIIAAAEEALSQAAA